MWGTVVAAPSRMPNNNDKNDKKNSNPQPSIPNEKQPRMPQTDKGMNKRDDKKGNDKLDDDGAPARDRGEDIERG